MTHNDEENQSHKLNLIIVQNLALNCCAGLFSQTNLI